MTVSIIVCVFLLHGLVVNGFPAGDIIDDGVDLGLLGVPAEEDEFSGTAPSEETYTIIEEPPCPEILLASNPTPSTDPEYDDAVALLDNVDFYAPIIEVEDIDNNKKIPKKVILGAILADAIMAEKGAEIDAKLAELDACVQAEMMTLSPLIQIGRAEADTSEIDSYVDSAIYEIESEIVSKLATIDEIVESELKRTEDLAESVVKATDLNLPSAEIGECSNATEIADMIANDTDKEKYVELELAKLETFLEAQLLKTETVIDSELEQINAFVELELAQIDDIVESELAKIDAFVEMELAKTDAAVKFEISKIEEFVDVELERVGTPVEGAVEFGDTIPEYGAAVIAGAYDYPQDYITEEVLYDDLPEIPVEGRVTFKGVAPAVGSCKILGTSTCDPILLPSIPQNPPTVGVANPMISTTPTPTPYCMTNIDTLTPHTITILPRVNLVRNPTDDRLDGATITGDVEFSGTARATGRASILADFPCAPLTATEEGPDGKKYIWISKKHSNNGDPILLPSIPQNPPTVGVANPMISTTPTPTPYCMPNIDTLTPHTITILPRVNLVRNPTDDRLDGATITGDVEFSGTARATGRATILADFPCAPLTATEEGPDGKKYIWISKKHSNNDPSPKLQPKPEYPTYPVDFPETIIMDSSKNYEKLMSEDLDVDFGGSGPVLVNGEARFEGTAPAYGAVSIRGHCA